MVTFNPKAPEEEKNRLLPGSIMIGTIIGLNTLVNDIWVNRVLPPVTLIVAWAADETAVVVEAG